MRLRLSVALKDLRSLALFGLSAPKYAQKIFVNPLSVSEVVVDCPFGRQDSGRVVEGDWDLSKMPVERLAKYQFCMARFVDGVSWEQAGAYEYMMRLIEQKPGIDGCYSLEDVKARYNRVDQIFQAIKAQGELKSRDQVRPGSFRERGGVYMHIGRDGCPVFAGGGIHRFAICRILGLTVVPAQVGVVHKAALGVWKSNQEKIWS